ncbi:hypothetical protein ACIBUY_36440 [Streptomyces sp. NPDC050085]|uniref:hypothetical protein n=1 Tax=Streptomyces sp. NPDC050085 TaxID=3365600 RepID=UPI0037B7C3A9
MRTSSRLTRSALTVAAVAAVPLTLAGPAFAAGITVTANDSTVTAMTTACQSGGNASLLSPGQANFAQGRQITLNSGTASWSGLSSGTYQVVIVCADGTTVGPASVNVTATATPTVAATSSPGAVRGGLGGTVEDFGPLTLTAGGLMVAAATVGGAWYLKRRGTGQRT